MPQEKKETFEKLVNDLFIIFNSKFPKEHAEKWNEFIAPVLREYGRKNDIAWLFKNDYTDGFVNGFERI